MDLPNRSSHMGSSFTWFNLKLKLNKVSVMGRISDIAKKFPMATCAASDYSYIFLIHLCQYYLFFTKNKYFGNKISSKKLSVLAR